MRRPSRSIAAHERRRRLAVGLCGTAVALFLGLLLGAFFAPADIWTMDYPEPKLGQLDPNYAVYLKVLAGQGPAPAPRRTAQAGLVKAAAYEPWIEAAASPQEAAARWDVAAATAAPAGEAPLQPDPPGGGAVPSTDEPQPPPVPLPSRW